MRIQTVPCLSDNLSYLVVDDSTRTCVAIDPGEAKPFLETLRDQNLDLIAILATHHHYDHIGGLSEMPEAPVWSSARDFSRVPGAGKSKVRATFDDSKDLTWSTLAQNENHPDLKNIKIRLQTMAIPGHTEGQVAIMFDDESSNDRTRHVFVGDTLFSMGCGRCLEGTPETLFESLQKIKALPPASLIYFGHEYTEKNALFWLSHRQTLQDETPGALRFNIETIALELENHMDDLRKSRLPKPAPRLRDEIRVNPFLQIQTAPEFRRWRELRNKF